MVEPVAAGARRRAGPKDYGGLAGESDAENGISPVSVTRFPVERKWLLTPFPVPVQTRMDMGCAQGKGCASLACFPA